MKQTEIAMVFFGIVAAFLSWGLNKSAVWALLHFFCSVFYVFYAVLTREPEVNRFLGGLFQ